MFDDVGLFLANKQLYTEGITVANYNFQQVPWTYKEYVICIIVSGHRVKQLTDPQGKISLCTIPVSKTVHFIIHGTFYIKKITFQMTILQS